MQLNPQECVRKYNIMIKRTLHITIAHPQKGTELPNNVL